MKWRGDTREFGTICCELELKNWKWLICLGSFSTEGVTNGGYWGKNDGVVVGGQKNSWDVEGRAIEGGKDEEWVVLRESDWDGNAWLPNWDKDKFEGSQLFSKLGKENWLANGKKFWAESWGM